VSLEGAIIRAVLVHRYAERLLEAMLETDKPGTPEVLILLERLDDVAMEVETCRAELRSLHPGEMP
jgi:hypothetical protein